MQTGAQGGKNRSIAWRDLKIGNDGLGAVHKQLGAGMLHQTGRRSGAV